MIVPRFDVEEMDCHVHGFDGHASVFSGGLSSDWTPAAEGRRPIGFRAPEREPEPPTDPSWMLL